MGDEESACLCVFVDGEAAGKKKKNTPKAILKNLTLRSSEE